MASGGGRVQPLYATSHAAATLFVLTLLVVSAIEIRQSTKQRDEATTYDAGSHYVFRLCLFAAIVCSVIALHAAPGAGIRSDRTLAWRTETG
jgi:hypothetical protein